MTLPIALVALSLFAMGAAALVRPERVVALFGTPSLSADGRNEVRAVYGGFGIALAALLVASARSDALRDGVQLALAVAFVGMASGRVVSRVADGEAGRPPWVFFFAEIALAGLLLVPLSLTQT